MILTVSSLQLLKVLSDLSKAIPTKSSLPILSNFLFDLKGGKLQVTASDSELTLRGSVAVDGEAEDGALAVPANLMLELLKEMPDQPVRFQATAENTLECSWSTGNSVFPAFPAEDYPALDDGLAEAQEVVFPSRSLATAIQRTAFATGNDAIRPVMNGIFFDMEPGRTTLVASDAHRLMCFTTDDVQTAGPVSFILHKKPATVLQSILEKEDTPVNIRFDGKMARFTFGETTMVCRLIEGNYPKYRDVIPSRNANILQIDRQLLLNTVRRVSVCASKASDFVKCTLSPSQLEITAQDTGFSMSAYEKVSCQYDGDNLSIGFRASMLSEILSAMTCATLCVKLADSTHAAILMPSEEEQASENFFGILMPILV